MPTNILMYHNIAQPPADGKLKGLYVSPLMFRFQMWYLKAAGFAVVPLHEVPGAARDNSSGRRVVALTFDDGYEDFYINAFPVLKKYGYPATVFIVSDLVGKANLWDENSLGIRKQLMTWDRIRQLSANNVSFGSHTRTHPFLTSIGHEDAKEEISASRKIIEEQTGVPVRTFCYPYGDYNDAVKNLVQEAGYEAAVTTSRGSVHAGDDPLVLRRAFIRHNTHPLHFLCKMHTSYEDRKGPCR